MLAPSDRGLWSYGLWVAATAAGADLGWRTESNVILSVVFDVPQTPPRPADQAVVITGASKTHPRSRSRDDSRAEAA